MSKVAAPQATSRKPPMPRTLDEMLAERRDERHGLHALRYHEPRQPGEQQAGEPRAVQQHAQMVGVPSWMAARKTRWTRKTGDAGEQDGHPDGVENRADLVPMTRPRENETPSAAPTSSKMSEAVVLTALP